MILLYLLCEPLGQCLVKVGETLGNGHGTVVFDEAVGTLSDAHHLAFDAHRVCEIKLHLTHPADAHFNFDDVLECGGSFVFA